MNEPLRYLPGFTNAAPEFRPEHAALREAFRPIIGVEPEWREFFRPAWQRRWEASVERRAP